MAKIVRYNEVPFHIFYNYRGKENLSGFHCIWNARVFKFHVYNKRQIQGKNFSK